MASILLNHYIKENFSICSIISIYEGYGTRSITKNCPEALILLMIQATFGVIIQALMTGGIEYTYTYINIYKALLYII